MISMIFSLPVGELRDSLSRPVLRRKKCRAGSPCSNRPLAVFETDHAGAIDNATEFLRPEVGEQVRRPQFLHHDPVRPFHRRGAFLEEPHTSYMSSPFFASQHRRDSSRPIPASRGIPRSGREDSRVLPSTCRGHALSGLRVGPANRDLHSAGPTGAPSR